MSYSKIVSPRASTVKSTPQSQPAKPNQVQNNAGGFVFKVDAWKQLERFLILGTSQPTYYSSAQKMTFQNADAVVFCALKDPERTMNVILDISVSGRAYKNDAALFALAVMAQTAGPEARKLAFANLRNIARIPTHLFDFNNNLDALGGKWNRSRRRAVSDWYNDQAAGDIAYSMLKYQQRNGVSHKDLLIQAHPSPFTNLHGEVFNYVVNGVFKDHLPSIIGVYESIKKATDEQEVVRLITDHKLTWEFVPSQWLGSADVWEALLPNLPPTALLRNLGRMSANGLLKPLSKAAKYVKSFLLDADRMRKARVHPFALLLAQRTYQAGQGHKGSLTWQPVQAVTDALEEAFYNGFNYTAPTGKRFLWAQDVSGSMSSNAGELPLTCAEAGAAMALTVARTEDQYHCMGFANEFRSLNIGKKTTLKEALATVSRQNFGSTDCALPMKWAQKNKIDVDTFVVFTDSETWSGGHHPFAALEEYRQARGIPARLIVLAATADEFTIANPDDAGMLDIAGLDANAPGLIADFAREAF